MDIGEIRQAVKVLSGQMAVRTLVVGGTTYVAMAAPGTDPTQRRWQVKKIVEDEDGSLSVTWALGTARYIHAADAMDELEYS